MKKCSLFLVLSLCSCAGPRILGDPYRDSSKVEVSRSDFADLEFKAFPDGPVCDGTHAKSDLTYTITFTPPVYQGIPPSKAAARSVELLQAIDEFLRDDFFYNASSPDLQTENFASCTGYRVYHGASGSQGVCWIKTSYEAAQVFNRNMSYLKHLLLAHSSDLAALRQNFALMSRGLSSKGALNSRDLEWRRFLSKARLEEADQLDGSVKYELSLDMSPVCRDLVPVSGLFSK